MGEEKMEKTQKYSPNPEFGKNTVWARVCGENGGDGGNGYRKCLGEVYKVCMRVIE